MVGAGLVACPYKHLGLEQSISMLKKRQCRGSMNIWVAAGVRHGCWDIKTRYIGSAEESIVLDRAKTGDC